MQRCYQCLDSRAAIPAGPQTNMNRPSQIGEFSKIKAVLGLNF
ncbi:Uncharacterised protein [Vibrio cholerae]|nr:Uncharacterised protein [Vibrio cholerae]